MGYAQFSRFRSALLIGSALAAVSTASVAQESFDGEVDEILVQGVRLQNQRIIDAKRDSNQIIDVLSQDELGRQPDFNIADAIRRAVGVFGQRDEEEAQFIGLRGLNPEFTFTTFDGAALATDGDSRRVTLEIFPATVISRTEVIKTRLAETDGNAIGGQIDFVTRSAYDTDGMYLNLTGMGGYFTADNFDAADNRPALRFDGTFSNTFGSEDEFGLVLAGSFFRRDQDEERFLTFYDGAFTAPTFMIWNGIESPYERFGGYGKLEFRPSDAFEADISGFYFRQDETFFRSSLIVFGSTNNLTSTGTGSGVITGAGGSYELLEADTVDEKVGANARFSYQMAEATNLSGRLSYSENSDSSPIFPNYRFSYAGPSGGFDYTFDFSGDGVPPQVGFLNRSTAEDLSNYRFSRLIGSPQDRSVEVVEADLKFDHTFNSELQLSGGVRYRSTDYSRDFGSTGFAYSGADPLILSDFGRLSSYVAPFAPAGMAIIDDDAFSAFRNANSSLFTSTASLTSAQAQDLELTEDIFAGFLSVSYESDRLAVFGGLRIEATDVDASAFGTVNGSQQEITDDNSYVDVLPSLNFNYDVRDDLKLRAAYNRALGRANFSDLNPSATITETSGVTTISGGNTQLDPRLSDNFDVSLEYYFDDGRSLVSAAVFHKRIQDEIYTLTLDNTSGAGGGGVVTTTRPENAEKASVTGIELSFIKDRLDFLPAPFDNFGVSANYTFTDASTTLRASNGTTRDVNRLILQPKQLANIALFYQQGPFEARAAYNFTGRYINSFSIGNPDQDDAIANFQMVDLQARYQVTDNFVLVAEARNLTDETNTELTGPNFTRTEDFSRFGRSFFAGVTYTY